jgi:hypothetical protein
MVSTSAFPFATLNMASPRRFRGRFPKTLAVILRKSAKVTEAKSCCNFCNRDAIWALHQARARSCQTQLPPEAERRNTYECPKMLSQCSFGNTAVRNEARSGHLAV